MILTKNSLIGRNGNFYYQMKSTKLGETPTKEKTEKTDNWGGEAHGYFIYFSPKNIDKRMQWPRWW